MDARQAVASPEMAADSWMGRIGLAVKRSQGANGAVIRARVAWLSPSTIATPPEPSAKPWNSLN